MKPTAPQATLLLYSCHAVLIIGVIMTGFSDSLATTDHGTGYRVFKNGHVIIGGFVSVHEYSRNCARFYPTNLGHLEAIIYAIEEINKDKVLLPNITLGYDIRDTCHSEIKTARYAYQFITASTLNCKAVKCITNHKCTCNVNGILFDEKNPRKTYTSTYPVIAIVGALSSSAAIPLATFLQAVRIPFVESIATSEELSSPMYGSFFRTVSSDANQAKAVADIIEHFGWRYVAVVAMDESYGHHGVMALERESIKRKTFCVQSFGYIPFVKYKNKLEMIVSSLKRRKTVKVIVIWTQHLHGKDLLTLAAKEGLENCVWIFSEAFAVKTFFIHFLSSIPNLSSTGIHIAVKLQSKAPENFRQHLKNRLITNHSSQENYLWKQFWKYLAQTNLSSHGLNNISSNILKPDQLVQLVQDDYDIYTIDAIYSVANALDQMLRCRKTGGPTSRENNVCPDNEETSKPSQLIEYLKRVEFQGVTGKVQFDTRGDPVEVIYNIVYFNISNANERKTVTNIIIGQWHKNRKERLQMNNTLKLWENDRNKERIPSSTCTDECKPGQWKVPTTQCCWKCLPCIDGSVSKTNGALNCTKCTKTQMANFNRTYCLPLPIHNIDWSDILAITLTIISVLGIIIDVCIFGILFYFRDTPIVKALNKVCTLVLLLGIALCFGITLLYIVRPSSVLCSLLKPLRYVVYTLCCSALFVKTMQIVHAFNISRHKKRVNAVIGSTKRQIIVLLVMICIEVFLGAVWILMDPPYANDNIFPKSHVFISCIPYRGNIGKVLDSIMLSYLVLVAGCCIYYAFRARNLPANFNEAKHISFSLYIFLLSWITYYPVDYAAEGWYVAVLSGATLLLSSYGLLGCIFGSKLFIIVLHPEKNTVQFIRAEMRQRQSVSNISTVKPV